MDKGNVRIQYFSIEDLKTLLTKKYTGVEVIVTTKNSKRMFRNFDPGDDDSRCYPNQVEKINTTNAEKIIEIYEEMPEYKECKKTFAEIT